MKLSSVKPEVASSSLVDPADRTSPLFHREWRVFCYL